MHFSCLPARFMCGVWVACEDTDENNGPLFYYPGSHRLPELSGYDLGSSVDDYFYPSYERVLHQLMTELGYKPVEFHARMGDALIWASNLVHGGRPVRTDGRTRWSQVSHYMFEGCIYYQPHSSEIPTGEYRMLDIIDLNTLEPVPSSYNGRPISVVPMANKRARLWFGEPPPEFAEGLAPAPAVGEPAQAEIPRAEPDPGESSVASPVAAGLPPEPGSTAPEQGFVRDLVRLVARHMDRHPWGHRLVQTALRLRR
jgi:Phytanoyl-CoA dioxygenase (PhyH)